MTVNRSERQLKGRSERERANCLSEIYEQRGEIAKAKDTGGYVANTAKQTNHLSAQMCSVGTSIARPRWWALPPVEENKWLSKLGDQMSTNQSECLATGTVQRESQLQQRKKCDY